ncbi:DUF983 domain-containing protein [Methyloceanibacter sp.]|uniref:DUF983 domain-containing protein n=1 Tax=Methyloceanibacter sp. TaxID=1965321 RepID=UPI003D6D486A
MQERSAPDSAVVVRGGARSTGERSIPLSLLRGARLTCPACGKGAMFRRYLKVADACPTCGEALHHHRADDAPPYFTIVIVGHVVVGLMLAVEMAYRPPLWLHAAIWLPLTVLLALLLLPPIKGALIGLQWALLMHGFDPSAEEEKIEPFDTGISNGRGR